MILYKNSNRQITKNFSEKELFSKSPDAPESHELSDKAIAGIQIIRDYFGVPVIVTSTYRTEKENKNIGGGTTSQHLKGLAIDVDLPDEYIQKYHAEILNKGSLYHQLRRAGVSGFGLYDNFIHIDARTNRMSETDEYGKLEVYDQRKKKILEA